MNYLFRQPGRRATNTTFIGWNLLIVPGVFAEMRPPTLDMQFGYFHYYQQ